MKKELKIESDKKGFFRKYVEIIKPILRIGSRRQLDILALLLFYNDQKKNIIDIKDRCKLIFDYDTRILIQDELKISDAILNNGLVALRKKGLIKGNNLLEKGILVYPEREFEISFKFTINE